MLSTYKLPLLNVARLLISATILLKVELLQFQVVCVGLLVFIRLFFWQIKNLHGLLVLGVPVIICDPKQPGGLSVLLKETWPGGVQRSGSNNHLTLEKGGDQSTIVYLEGLPKPENTCTHWCTSDYR